MPSSPPSPRSKTAQRRKKYYAIVKSPYLDRPAIFSSWARVHPLVTGVASFHKGFETLSEAQLFLEKRGVAGYDTVVRTKREVTGSKPGKMFYAVANGRNPGITEVYGGLSGAEAEVINFSGSCFQGFGTREEAEEFMEDWIDQFVLIQTRQLREDLKTDIRSVKRLGASKSIGLRMTEKSNVETLAEDFGGLKVGACEAVK